MSGSIDNTTSWAPVGETPFDLEMESVNLIGSTTINGVAYGVVLTLYCACLTAIIPQIRSGARRGQGIFHLVYTTVMIILGTVYTAANSRIVQLGYVNYRNFPGGPFVYSLFASSLPINIAGVVSLIIIACMNDALLVWRIWVLYQRVRFSTFIIGFSIVLYLATFAMSMVTLIESVLPNQTLWSNIEVKFILSYYILNTMFTVIVTSFMIARILLVRKAFIDATGRREYGSHHLSIAAMIIESSALYTVWGIIFLGLYVANHPIQFIFLASLPEVQIIAPLLIIYRVSVGRAWQRDTSQKISQMNFHTTGSSTVVHNGTSPSRTNNGSEGDIHIFIEKNISGSRSLNSNDVNHVA